MNKDQCWTFIGSERVKRVVKLCRRFGCHSDTNAYEMVMRCVMDYVLLNEFAYIVFAVDHGLVEEPLLSPFHLLAPAPSPSTAVLLTSRC